MKYFANEDTTQPDIFIQYCIANELAEANKLKQIELDMKMAQLADPAQLAHIRFFWHKQSTEVLTS